MLSEDIKQEILETSNIEISNILNDSSLNEEEKDSQIKEVFNNIQEIIFYQINEQLKTVNEEIEAEIKKSDAELDKVIHDPELNAEQRQTIIEKIIQNLIAMIDKLFQQKRNEKVAKQEKLAILKQENDTKLNILLDKASQKTNSDSETR